MTTAPDPLVELVLRAQERSVGTSRVRRVLPSAKRLAIGPFVFLDHFGPEALPAGHGFDVRPHPHIGLATVTYLFEGVVVHRDSLGSEQEIRPGELNWMSAGRGIVHSERSPDDARALGGTMHGLQLWVALPREHEEDEPTFEHVPASAITTHDVGGASVTLIAGTAWGLRARAQVRSPLFFAEARLSADERVRLPDEHPERAIYVVDGSVRVGDSEHGAHTLVVVTSAARELVATSSARVAMLGGASLPEPRLMRWNFVATSKDLLDRAEERWRSGRFPRIPTDDGPPLPMP